jgi:hypothetical protein
LIFTVQNTHLLSISAMMIHANRESGLAPCFTGLLAQQAHDLRPTLPKVGLFYPRARFEYWNVGIEQWQNAGMEEYRDRAIPNCPNCRLLFSGAPW